MPGRNKAPTLRLRRFAAKLRELREAAGLSPVEVADLTGLDRATLFRIEGAKVRPQARSLRALLDAYRASDQDRNELTALLKAAAEQTWLQPTASLPSQYATHIGFESEAEGVRNYEILAIPGLLQTENYARAMIKGTVPDVSRDEVESRVSARLERQRLLTRPTPLKLWAVIDESALLREVGGRQVMHDQLAKLREAADEPNITIQVIPRSAGAYPGMHGAFVLLEFPGEGHDVVYMEGSSSDLFLEGEQDISHYSMLFEHLRAVAAGPDATRALLATAQENWKEGRHDRS
ncbi:helix-turn-helix domain-containing protein [Streptosporangium saharense]|uniref:Transcriptional regulator with XRE-family HTH domain n=1 Tax=Streptosporangium saharense TaxID=1706840 RepID=A0A7W7QQK8_9ACTN|nr:helix-turn-helix transcriptional regulator [Streptosporangium saharense]MBB4917883.1 transcriptional regulator with XRE-family HTH domain [Streptosporangium saharense]